MLTVLTVDEALQHMCAQFREQADRGSITPSERDLLIDGAVMLAMRVDDLAREDDRTDAGPFIGDCSVAVAPGLAGERGL